MNQLVLDSKIFELKVRTVDGPVFCDSNVKLTKKLNGRNLILLAGIDTIIILLLIVGGA